MKLVTVEGKCYLWSFVYLAKTNVPTHKLFLTIHFQSNDNTTSTLWSFILQGYLVAQCWEEDTRLPMMNLSLRELIMGCLLEDFIFSRSGLFNTILLLIISNFRSLTHAHMIQISAFIPPKWIVFHTKDLTLMTSERFSNAPFQTQLSHVL